MAKRNFTDGQEAEIARIYLSGISAKEIARHYGLGHHISIVAALKRQGITQRSVSDRNRLYAVDATTFDVIDNEEKAYWLGFLHADGHVAREKTLILQLGEKDIDHVKKFKVFMQSTSPLKHVTSNRSSYGSSEQVRIEMTDKHLGKRLIEIGMSTHRQLSGIGSLQFVPNHLVSHWIRGWFDGDGSAYTRKCIGFCGCEDLLSHVMSILAEEKGLNDHLKLHPFKTVHYLKYDGFNVATKAAEYLYKDATIYLTRKREVVDSWTGRVSLQRDSLGRFQPTQAIDY